MDSDNRRFDSVYTTKVRAGRRRTYFFDVRQTKGEDYYVTITESTKKFNGDGYERHKIFIYKEDFNRFIQSLQDAVDHVKNDLLPEYDYDEFTRKQEEWEKQKQEEEDSENSQGTPKDEVKEEVVEDTSSEEDMTW